MLVLVALACVVWLLGTVGLVGLCRAAAGGDATLHRLDRRRPVEANRHALPT